MYEARLDSAELSPTVAAIAEAMRDWLAAEVASSSAADSRNQYLDDFDKLQATIRLPFNDMENTNAHKAKAHYDRMRHFLPVFEQHPEDDNVSAKTLFFIQMHLSGLFRKQCYMQATGQEDYAERRQEALGIDISEIVEDEVAEQSLPINTEELILITTAANKDLYEMNKRLHETGATDLGLEESPTVDMLRQHQEQWLRIAVDYILFAAQIRGDLSRVPFWEAKSISDIPAVYYPFAA